MIRREGFAPKEPGPSWTVAALAGLLARLAHESPQDSGRALNTALDGVTIAARRALRNLEQGE